MSTLYVSGVCQYVSLCSRRGIQRWQGRILAPLEAKCAVDPLDFMRLSWGFPPFLPSLFSSLFLKVASPVQWKMQRKKLLFIIHLVFLPLDSSTSFPQHTFCFLKVTVFEFWSSFVNCPHIIKGKVHFSWLFATIKYFRIVISLNFCRFFWFVNRKMFTIMWFQHICHFLH